MPFTPDPDFLEGCIHTVAVQADANASGASRSPRGGGKEDWQPVSGQEAVVCRVVPDRDAERDEDSKQGAIVFHKILLPVPLDWTQSNQLVFVDPQGATHLIRVTGQPRNAHFQDVFWVAKGQEFVN